MERLINGWSLADFDKRLRELEKMTYPSWVDDEDHRAEELRLRMGLEGRIEELEEWVKTLEERLSTVESALQTFAVGLKKDIGDISEYSNYDGPMIDPRKLSSDR